MGARSSRANVRATGERGGGCTAEATSPGSSAQSGSVRERAPPSHFNTMLRQGGAIRRPRPCRMANVLAPLRIVVPLQDATAKDGDPGVLEFKIGSYDIPPATVWCRDGILLGKYRKLSHNFNDGVTQLVIDSVCMDDYGLYHAISTDGTTRVQTSAALYVRPSDAESETIYLKTHASFDAIAPIRHITDQYIQENRALELDFQLNTPSAKSIYWYKSNVPIIKNSRTIILNDKRSSNLVILNANNADSGIYQVVVKTDHGIVSSFAKVIVDRIYMLNERRIPYVEVALPDELECSEFEEVRLRCKVRTNDQTKIRWIRNGIQLPNNEKFERQDYGNGYIGLKIKNIETRDAAVYKLSLSNLRLGTTDSTSCSLKVTDFYENPTPTAKLMRPLESVVACFGCQVVLKCTFKTAISNYLYVVWQVGCYKVERTNHLFNVTNHNGQFYLVIKSLQAEMAGMICCELRRSYPSRRSAFVANTSANLAIVPPAYMEKEIKSQTRIKKEIHYVKHVEVVKKPLEPIPEYSGQENEQESINPDDNRKSWLFVRRSFATDPLEFVFCRTDDDRYAFVDISKISFSINTKSLMVYKKVKYRSGPLGDEDLGCSFVIKWNGVLFPACFRVQLIQTYNDIDIGVTKKAEIELRNPSREHALKFRISAVTESGNETDLSYEPPMEDEPRTDQICKIRAMEEFPLRYAKTGEKIGNGAFGSVVLVKSSLGDYFAAKTLKIKTEQRRISAMREFEMMRGLKHPKLIELVDVFVGRDSVVFIMDYLWGGELFDRMAQEDYIKEIDVTFYVRQILEGLKYLHSLNIAHLDIKPDNIIFVNPNSRQIKLIDLGLARVIEDDEDIRAVYGTRDYVAPEILNYDPLTVVCDMWSLGVVIYMMLSGVMPFAGDSWTERSYSISNGQYNFKDPAFLDVSKMGKSFISQLLVLDPSRRLTAAQALAHPWVVHGPTEGIHPPMKRTKENLKSYLASYRAHWQGQGCWGAAGNWLCGLRRPPHHRRRLARV